jgi:hypothetical protein
MYTIFLLNKNGRLGLKNESRSPYIFIVSVFMKLKVVGLHLIHSKEFNLIKIK